MPTYSPEALYSAFRQGRDKFTSKDFFNRTGTSRLREMWCAARFSAGVELHLSPCEVNIDEIDDQSDTDFRLIRPGRIDAIQVVEVQAEGRQRGSEYRERIPGSTWLEPVLSNDIAIQRIIETVQRKSDKHYSEQNALQLLVYVNLGTLGLDFAELHKAIAPAAAGFGAVWLMTEEHFACVHHVPPFSAPPGWMNLPPSSL